MGDGSGGGVGGEGGGLTSGNVLCSFLQGTKHKF